AGNLTPCLDPPGAGNAAVARRLRPAGVADLGERLANDRRNGLAVGEVGARVWGDVDQQLVRVLGVGATGRPGMEVDHGEVRGPGHLGELRDAELVGVTAR